MDLKQNVNKWFSLYKAEWFKDNLFEHFSEPNYFPQLKEPLPCVLIGGRGTGKTTVLRGLSYEGQYAILQRQGKTAADMTFYGIYYKVNTNRVTAFDGPELSLRKWQGLFGHYMNLVLCQMILNFVRWYGEETSLRIELSERSLKRIALSLGMNEVENLRFLAEQIEDAILTLEASINDIADNVDLPTSLQGAPIDILATEITNLDLFKGKQFYFLIDEYENYLDYQQRVLNTILKHAGGPYTFKIGVRELGWRERTTLNSNEQLTHPADYIRINIAEAFDQEKFKSFAQMVVNHRIRIASNDNTLDIANLLNDVSLFEEAELLIDKNFSKGLQGKYADQLDEVEKQKLSETSIPEKWFIEYWSNGAGNGDFPKNFRAYLKAPQEWRTRFDNHLNAALFVVRKGKSGIRRYYCGWNSFLSLAHGNIRYLLELLHNSFLLHFETDESRPFPISIEDQTRAAIQVGKKNLSELEGLSVNGAKLTKLLLSLGRIFGVLAENPLGHAPEVNQFDLGAKEGSSEEKAKLKEILDQAVMHQALIRHPGSKLSDAREIRDYDYMIHPIFAPFFVISHRRKRKLVLESAEILGLVESHRKTIDAILKKKHRIKLETMPDQLELFHHYYAESET